MALKKYKPVTPGQRQLTLIDRKGLHKGGPLKKLTEGQKSYGGRNSSGRITVRWRGGGHKQRYRIIDFKRAKHDILAPRAARCNIIGDGIQPVAANRARTAFG